jgi:hypothetical protein
MRDRMPRNRGSLYMQDCIPQVRGSLLMQICVPRDSGSFFSGDSLSVHHFLLNADYNSSLKYIHTYYSLHVIAVIVIDRVRMICYRLSLYFRRSLYLKHDYLCLRLKCHSVKIIHVNGGKHATNAIYHHFINHFSFLKLYLILLMHNLQNFIAMKLIDEIANDIPVYRDDIGGGARSSFTSAEIHPYILNPPSHLEDNTLYQFLEHTVSTKPHPDNIVICRMPLSKLVAKIPLAKVRQIAGEHNVVMKYRSSAAQVQQIFRDHTCDKCNEYVSLFVVYSPVTQVEKNKRHLNKLSVKARRSTKLSFQRKNVKHNENFVGSAIFPPDPLSKKLSHTIITDFCKDTAPEMFVELGCAVCGRLTQRNKLTNLTDAGVDLNILKAVGLTRVERHQQSDPVMDIEGPILDPDCDKVCKTCKVSLSKNKLPLNALANGLWIGKVPEVLQDLTYVERLLIARVRHNRCVIQVSSGGSKLYSNAITFANPVPKIYQILPPPVNELDEVLAIIFSGPCRPTQDDFKRTPLLVRRNKVILALEWLKLNHIEYNDIGISQENMDKYAEDVPPVVVDYRRADSNKIPEATSLHDTEEEAGTTVGDCPFVVHGLTGESIVGQTTNVLKGMALKHLNSEGKILAIGHGEKPESIYSNPQLYPSMFPWLFPYGLGGIGNAFNDCSISENQHKKHLLMYHDKRFQKDSYFILIAFNHKQIKQSTTGGYLLAEKRCFGEISNRLMDIDQEVLADLSKRMAKGDHIKPSNDEEKACFQILKDLDHVAGKVEGSLTSKKYMRNEIWAITSYLGAPSWYITLSPADVKHPICLYYADTKEEFMPAIKGYEDSQRLIANNPVAGARFFDYMIKMFIKHVLGVKTNHPGLYGETSAYYGTVEQQGRLTLHLHLLLWLKNSLTPQEIRDKIMNTDSDFQKRIIEYLESVHAGEFFTGTLDEVRARRQLMETDSDYKPPTNTLPETPPPECTTKQCDGKCIQCIDISNWWKRFEHTVDDLLCRSNVHRSCNIGESLSKDNNKQGKKKWSGCLNKHGQCKARFPRKTFQTSEVDPNTGALNMKKGEPMINFFTPVLTYIFRCNTDVTSLLSGTAIKAVITYVTDYITKLSLKTHIIFDTVRSVFNNNSELLGGTAGQREKSRKIMTKIVNALSSQLEIGSPMASLYLLENKDHYTNCTFVPFYWKSYVHEVRKVWYDNKEQESTEKVLVLKKDGKYKAMSSVDDYIYRPEEYSDMNLLDWIRLSRRERQTHKPRSKRKQKICNANDELDLFQIVSQEATDISKVENGDDAQSDIGSVQADESEPEDDLI